MHYDEKVYRPPQEANTVLLQVTSGCSHNKCTFCDMYKGVKFKVSPIEEIKEDLEEIKTFYSDVDRIYLVGGDPFCLSTQKLKEICLLINKYLPCVKTITMYASVKNIMSKTLEELIKLRELGINELAMGIETGNEQTLKETNKGHTVEDAIRETRKLDEAKIRYRVGVMQGIMGKGKGIINAVDTGKLLSQINPSAIAAMSTMVMPNTELYEQVKKGEFIEATEYERIVELKTLVENLFLEKEARFNSIHVSNSVNLRAILPRQKEELINALDNFLKSTSEEEFYFNRDRVVKGHH